MLHKRNDLEIVEVLRKREAHIREVAKSLDMTPSTAMRIMDRLRDERVVDFRSQGKNKVYQLKKTPESYTYLHMVENYKLLKILQIPWLRRIVLKLKEFSRGELIVLFGSFATGNTREGSDIDIYVETDDSALKNNLRKISEKLSIKTGKLDKDSPLTREIIRNHVVIQNVQRLYEIHEEISR